MISLIGIRPISEHALVDIIDRGEQALVTKSGAAIWLPDDDDAGDGSGIETKHRGIRSRRARILALSPEGVESGLALGDLVILDTLKWARGVPFRRLLAAPPMQFWRIHVDDILMSSTVGRDDYIAELNAKMKKALV